RLDTGLLVEVWNKGLIWDKAVGYLWLPLTNVQYSNEEGEGQWHWLDGDRLLENGEVKGTANPTGDSLLLDCRFELPWALDPCLTNGPCGTEERTRDDSTSPSSLPPPSRPSLSTVKLLNTVTFETIDRDEEENDDLFRSNQLTAAASETVDSGIGNDELGAETSISRFLSKCDEARDEAHETVNGLDEGGGSSFRFSFQKPLSSQKDTELSSPASESKAFSWNTDTSASSSSYATTSQSNAKVTLVTTKFASLSVSSPDRDLPCKTFTETSSPSATPSSGIFNIKLLKENVLRESEGHYPLQPSPNLEDSSSTSSYQTLSGSSGYFSKSSATDEVPSSKTSPAAEPEYPSDTIGDVPPTTFSFLRSPRSPARTEEPPPPPPPPPPLLPPPQPPPPLVQDASEGETHIQTTSSEDSFKPTRFYFLTKDYLPPIDDTSEETTTTTTTTTIPHWSPLAVDQPPISSGFTFSFSKSTEASATTLTSATPSPLVASTSSPTKLSSSKFFSILSQRQSSPGSDSPPSVASAEGEKEAPLTFTKFSLGGASVTNEKSNKLFGSSEKSVTGASETKQSGELKKDREETEAQELQRKLEILNNIMDQDTRGAPAASRNPQLTFLSVVVVDDDDSGDIDVVEGCDDYGSGDVNVVEGCDVVDGGNGV
ncbi:hypothetical protein Pcinc_020283, partial [Petrolisthes cinctipes]